MFTKRMPIKSTHKSTGCVKLNKLIQPSYEEATLRCFVNMRQRLNGPVNPWWVRSGSDGRLRLWQEGEEGVGRTPFGLDSVL